MRPRWSRGAFASPLATGALDPCRGPSGIARAERGPAVSGSGRRGPCRCRAHERDHRAGRPPAERPGRAVHGSDEPSAGQRHPATCSPHRGACVVARRCRGLRSWAGRPRRTAIPAAQPTAMPLAMAPPVSRLSSNAVVAGTQCGWPAAASTTSSTTSQRPRPVDHRGQRLRMTDRRAAADGKAAHLAPLSPPDQTPMPAHAGDHRPAPPELIQPPPVLTMAGWVQRPRQ